MDAIKFLDLYEKSINKEMSNEMKKPAKRIGVYASYITDLRCIERMRAALAQAATSTDTKESA